MLIRGSTSIESLISLLLMGFFLLALSALYTQSFRLMRESKNDYAAHMLLDEAAAKLVSGDKAFLPAWQAKVRRILPNAEGSILHNSNHYTFTVSWQDPVQSFQASLSVISP